MRIRSSDKDQLIAELRQQLYDLKNQERDYRGVNDEIFSMDNRYKLLSEEKVRSEMEGRARLDRGMDEIADCRKQVEDLKYMLSDKSRQNMELQDELMRSKRVLDEKFFESGKLRDESNAKGDQVVDLRAQVAELERDIDLVKAQRADMFREIQRLRDVCDMKTKEALDQNDRLKALDFDLQKTHARICEMEKIVEDRSFEIRNRQVQLDDCEKEIARLKDINTGTSVEIGALRKDVDRVSTDCYDLRKHIESTEARNVELGAQLRSQDIQIKDRDENLHAVRRDIEGLTVTNANLRTDLNDQLAEKDALDRHSRVLLGQNDDLTRELERFVNTDEVLRTQLDRRARVLTVQDANAHNIGYSASKVYEARSRSPPKRVMTAPYPPPGLGSTAAHTSYIERSRSPARRYGGAGSPLRSSYRPTYKA